MLSGMRRVPAERVRHAKRLGHVQSVSEPVAPVVVGGDGAIVTTSQGAASTPTMASQTTPAGTLTKQPLSSISSSTQSTTLSTTGSPTVPATLSTITHSLEPATQPSSSVVAQSLTLTPTPTTSFTPTSQSVVGATNRGLSGGAIAGIIAGSVIVGIALIVFFVRKTYLRRRENRRISWNGARGLGEGFLNEPNLVPNVGERSASFISTANTSQRNAPPSPFDFDARGKSPYSPPPPLAQLRPTLPYTTPTPPSATYNNPVYPTQSVPLTYNPGNTMGRRAAGTDFPPILPSVGLQRTLTEAMVRCTFVPTLPDELSITTGERIFVVEQYDDGWDLCMNVRGERGMVPRECLEHAPSDQPDIGWNNVKRSSSLNLDGKRY